MPENAAKTEIARTEMIVLRDDNGVVTQETSLKNDLPDGPTVLYRFGKVIGRLSYVAGKQHGESLFYNDANEVSVRAMYENGVLHGESQYFGASGIMVRKSTYAGGVLNGRTVHYFPTGAVREVAYYRSGMLDGELARFSPEGKLVQRICYTAGKVRPCPPLEKRRQEPGKE